MRKRTAFASIRLSALVTFRGRQSAGATHPPNTSSWPVTDFRRNTISDSWNEGHSCSSAARPPSEASAPKHDPSIEAPCKGVFWSASRKCFRAKNTEGGRTKMKDFRGPTASADAMEFVQLQDRSDACD